MSRERVLVCMEQLGEDELEVLAEVAEGMAVGRSVYGELRIATDKRNMEREALAEARDGLVYTAVALIRARRARERPFANVRDPADVPPGAVELWTCMHGCSDRPCERCGEDGGYPEGKR